MDQELISYLDKRFDAVDKRLEKVEKDTSETRILVEDLRDEVQLVAEGLAGVVDSFKVHRTEVSEEVKGIRVLVQQSYSDLDRRVRILEVRETDH
jgi:predicted  nucleic acid-binding Zn-ribbon protein